MLILIEQEQLITAACYAAFDTSIITFLFFFALAYYELEPLAKLHVPDYSEIKPERTMEYVNTQRIRV